MQTIGESAITLTSLAPLHQKLIFSVVDDVLCDVSTFSRNVTQRPTTRQTTPKLQETMMTIGESAIISTSSATLHPKLIFSVVDDALCDVSTLSLIVAQRPTTRQTTPTIQDTMETIDESAITSTSLAPLHKKLIFCVVDDALCDVSTLSLNATQRPTSRQTTFKNPGVNR